MSVATIGAAMVAARMGETQIAIAGKMLRMSAEADRSVVQLLDGAQENLARLANVGPGIGAAVDITA
jgi:predicted protein tyrosine phosphatase